MKQPKNSLQLPKSIADTRRIQNKLTTVGSGEKDLQFKVTVDLQSPNFANFFFSVLLM